MTFWTTRDSYSLVHADRECSQLKHAKRELRRLPDDVANRMAETTRDFCDDCVTGSDTELP
jgi:hypothetical protein